MLTDDPGTPGNGHVEINLAWTDQRTPGSTLVGLPLLDANYGIGDRIQLNYQASWNILEDSGSPTQSGLSDSQVAVKWRFYDAGETGLQASTFPRVTFVNPGSNSDRRGTADPNGSFLLPFELRRDLGFISVNADIGHSFSGAEQNRGWIGGLCLGRQLTKAWEIDAEVHFNESDRLQRGETVLNLGSRGGPFRPRDPAPRRGEGHPRHPGTEDVPPHLSGDPAPQVGGPALRAARFPPDGPRGSRRTRRCSGPGARPRRPRT